MTTAEIERLLSHEGFLRDLAGRLVADPAAQDDVVQETWLAALSRPQDERSREPRWLATVARNAARMRWRSERRRRRREQAAARPERTEGVEAVRERERARRTVVEAVLRLEEPYRTVVLLRFYDGKAPRQVAERLCVPVETVRTRTRRAVERLREDLQQREGARSWRRALAPLSLAPAVAPHGPAVPLGGWLLMSLQARLVWLLPLLLLVAGAGTYGLLCRSDANRMAARPAVEAPPEAATASEAGPGDAPPRLAGAGGASAAPPPATRAASDVFRHARPRAALRGLVLSGRTYAPVVGAAVTALLERGGVPDGLSIGQRPLESAVARTDAEGRFAIVGLPVGAYLVSAEHPEEGTARMLGSAAESPLSLRLYVLPPDPAVCRVRVVDAARRVAPDATVEVALLSGAWRGSGTTDPEGIARFSDLPPTEGMWLGWITARSAAGVGRAEVRLDPRYARGELPPIEVVLAPAGAIAGRLTLRGEGSLAGSRIAAWSLAGGQGAWANAMEERSVTVGADGAFRLEPLSPGPYTLLATSPSGLRMDLDRRTTGVVGDWEPLRVEVETGRTTAVEVPVVEGGTIRGRVRRSDGAPVAGARVGILLPQGPGDHAERYTRGGAPVWRLDAATPDARRFPLTFHLVPTDEEGRYEATGLLPGRYRVLVVVGEDLSFVRKDDVAVEDGGVVELEHRVEGAGTLELVTRPVASLGVRREGEATCQAALVTQPGAVGAVTLPGLAAGRWEVVDLHSDERIAPVPLASFEIRVGEITYVDVSDAGDARVRLRLLAGGRPLAGVPVFAGGHGWATPITDDEGRATWALTTFGPRAAVEVTVLPAGPRSLPLSTRVPLRDEETEIVLPAGALEARVQDASGRTVPGAAVTLRSSRRAPEDEWWLAVSEHRVRTDLLGVARWGHLPPGDYVLEARLEGGGGRVTAAVTVAEGPASLALRVPEPGVVRIRVLGLDGRPAAGVAVGLRVLPKGSEPEGWQQALDLTENGWRTDAQGILVARGVPEGLARAYAWVMEAGGWSAVANAEVEVRVVAGGTIDAELALKPVPR